MKDNTFPIQAHAIGEYREITDPIRVGETVSARQILCFVGGEPISSAKRGIIKKNFYENGERVVGGATLFIIETAETE